MEKENASTKKKKIQDAGEDQKGSRRVNRTQRNCMLKLRRASHVSPRMRPYAGYYKGRPVKDVKEV